MNKIASGIYPVMITPFSRDGGIDFEAVDRLTEFYVQSGCHGLFAVCQSSEMFFLTEDERVSLARRVAKAANGRLTVVASGHVSDDINSQLRELKRISETGVDGVVLVSNRLAGQDESDDVLIENLEKILTSLPDVTFGMYECPHPYKRLLSEKVLRFMAESGRFAFIKDTSCDAALIEKRVKLLNGRIQLFNANSATLLDTLKSGADGFSGIMANFYPDILVWLYENYQVQSEKTDKLQPVLSLLSGVERGYYPVNCKYHMNLIGVPMELITRTRNHKWLSELDKLEMRHLTEVENEIRKWISENR